MNKFILNFSDFILNENKRLDKTLRFNSLYEDESTLTKATTSQTWSHRLQQKLLNKKVCKNNDDVYKIASKSTDLFDAAEKVYKNEPSSNFFKENLELLLTAGVVLVGGYIAFKNGKKIKLGGTLTNIIEGIKTKLQNPIIKTLESKMPVIRKTYEALEASCNKGLSYIKKIENKPYYNDLNTKGKTFILNIEKVIGELQTNFKTQYEYINSEEIIKKANLKTRFNKIKVAITNHKTIIQGKIDELKLQNIDELFNAKPIQADSKIITMPDYSSSKINSNSEISKDIKNIIIKYEKFLEELNNINKEFDDILITTGINKPSSKTLDDIIQPIAKATRKTITSVPPSANFLSKLKKYAIPSGIAIPSIYTIYTNFSVIKDLFKDTPELQPAINMIENKEQSKDYLVKKMQDELSYFSYDKYFSGLNIANIEFNDGYEYYKNDLKGAILYDLAEILIDEMKINASVAMYGILNKITTT